MSRCDFIICFHLFKGIFYKTWKFFSCLDPSTPVDNRVTASRSRRLRVLLTGRHGNLATSLQWPKVDGLRAGAPEQTEQKSVHARTRNRTCNVRRSLYIYIYISLSLCLSFSFSLSLSLSLSLSVVCSILFFSLLAVSIFESRRELSFTLERTCWWCLCLVSRAIQIPGEDDLPRPKLAVDSDIMEWFDRLRSRWVRCKKNKIERKRIERVDVASAGRALQTGWPTSATACRETPNFTLETRYASACFECRGSHGSATHDSFDTREFYSRECTYGINVNRHRDIRSDVPHFRRDDFTRMINS